jgi:hypothetical protein
MVWFQNAWRRSLAVAVVTITFGAGPYVPLVDAQQEVTEESQRDEAEQESRDETPDSSDDDANEANREDRSEDDENENGNKNRNENEGEGEEEDEEELLDEGENAATDRGKERFTHMLAKQVESMHRNMDQQRQQFKMQRRHVEAQLEKLTAQLRQLDEQQAQAEARFEQAQSHLQQRIEKFAGGEGGERIAAAARALAQAHEQAARATHERFFKSKESPAASGWVPLEGPTLKKERPKPVKKPVVAHMKYQRDDAVPKLEAEVEQMRGEIQALRGMIEQLLAGQKAR